VIEVSRINNLLFQLSDAIKSIDQECSLIQFGSSLSSAFYNKMDIDLLILSKKDYSQNQYDERLIHLKQNLIGGGNASSFKIDCPEIELKIRSVLKTQISADLLIIPKFVFGPFQYKPIHSNKRIVFLHFKGPINREQFLSFCEEFPFHGKSILLNHKVISGHFNEEFFLTKINLKWSEFLIFSDALKKRVEKSKERIDIKKCIRKLVLNYNMFDGTDSKGKLNSQLLKEKITPLEIKHSEDLCFLKSKFKELLFFLSENPR